MKNRQGFVSNSSSSSFIVTNAEKKTIDILKSMYETLQEEWNSEDEGLIKIGKFIESKASDFDEPICIPFTCNYETFIFRNGDNILIDTCNNHAFYELGYDSFDCGYGIESVDYKDIKFNNVSGGLITYAELNDY